VPALPEILYQDARFVVLNKPSAVPVHPGPKGGASVEDVFPHLSRRKDGPWLAHRLDADTAGCLLIALRKTALLAAQAEFSAGRVHKTYWAIVRGTPPAESGTVDAPLKRITNKTGWRMAVDPTGQQALTHWRVLGHADGLTWLECTPKTGRTHQVRVHCAELGTPILGDPLYGGGTDHPLHLLARALRLALDPPISAEAEPPAHMLRALQACGYRPRATMARTAGHNA